MRIKCRMRLGNRTSLERCRLRRMRLGNHMMARCRRLNRMMEKGHMTERCRYHMLTSRHPTASNPRALRCKKYFPV